MNNQADTLPMLVLKVAMIGFGEAGEAFVTGWRQSGIDATIKAFDIKTDDPEAAERKFADYRDAGIAGCKSCAEAVCDADIVFSLVTAGAALKAAKDASSHISPGAFYFDCNSCAPETKKKSDQVISAAGGRYVDVAVMAPVHPKLHRAPLLVCGKHANDVLTIFERLGMNATLVAGDVGRASTIKMVRSTMIKGLEALTLECFLSARAAGVEQEVVDSLDASFPDFNWNDRAGYMIERAMTHGIRRAEEMREVAKTIGDLDLPNDMAQAITDWQQRVGELRLAAKGSDFRDHTDQILARLKGSN